MQSMMNIRQRLSLATGIQSIAGTTDNVEVDEQIRSLYTSHEDLEKRCAESATSYLSTLPRKSLTTSNGVDPLDANTAIDDKQLTASCEKSPESVVEGLPAEYFTLDYDPIGPNLTEISSWEESEMIERFMDKIEEADTDKDVIIGHLTTMIDANYNDLMECMRNVQSIDIDLCRAGIQIGHGRQRLRSACDIIHSGAIKVKSLHTKRGKMSKMSETIRSLQAIKGIHKSMMSNINTGEVGKAANHALSVLECLKHDSFDKFIALKSIGQSTERSVITIRQKSDKALKRLCSRKFSALDYENILTAYILLDHLCEHMDVDMYDISDKMADSSSSFYFDSVGCIEGLSQRINRYQLDDIDDCLHTAVTEYIYSAQQKTSKPSDPQGRPGLNEHVDIAEVPLNMLYRHLTADVIAPCVVRSCELLADVAHTHFLLTQWHREPFHPQNYSSEYLHRKPLDLAPAELASPSMSTMAALNVKTSRTSLDSHTSSNHNTTSSAHTSTAGTPKKELASRKSFNSTNAHDSSVHKPAQHSEIIDLGREFHDEESDGEDADEDDVVAEGEDAISALASTYHKMTQAPSSLSEELTSSIMASFVQHFPHILHKDQDKDHLPHVKLNGATSATEAFSNTNTQAGLRLAMVFDGLQHSRAMLWEEMLRALVSMLNMMTFTSEVKIEDFLAMAWALNNMAELGREFCGSESKVLINILQDKSKEYFHNFHCESFQLIRDMLEAESWQSVPIDLAASGGILGIIKTTLVRDAARSGKIYFNSSSAAAIKAQNGGSDSPTQDDETAEGTGGEKRSSTPTPDTALTTTEGETPETPAVTAAALSILMRFGAEGNPFHFMTNAPVASTSSYASTTTKSGGKTPPPEDDKNEISIERKELRSFWKVLQDTTNEPSAKAKRAAEQSYTVVTQTALNGVAKFVAKYLHLMYLLPASAKGIFDNLSQLFDYYLCAVFNGFMPFDERQKFLAAVTKMNSSPPSSSKEFQLLQEYLERALDMLVETATTDAAFDHNDSHDPQHGTVKIAGAGGSLTNLDTSEHSGRSSESSPANPSPANPSPLGSTHNTNNSTSNHGSLNGAPGSASTHSMSTLHMAQMHTTSNTAAPNPPLSPMGTVMVEGTKMSALLRPPGIPLNIESTCMALNERIVAAESCCFIAVILLELKGKIMKLVPEEHAQSVEDFVSQYQRVAGQLRALIYRASCPQLIKHNQILSMITDCAWDSKKMRTEVHDWVHKLADHCRAVWDYMMLTEQFAESSPLLREQVWLEICQAAFDVCLEGYSKVRKCSVEGRSSMTTDTMALHDALNTIHLCRPPRGKHYIDNFLCSAMLSEEDLLAWVRDNWESYAYRHVHGLLTQVLFSMLNSKKLKDAVAMIDSLYELKDTETTSTLSGLLSQTDGTFSRFSSQFRRPTMMSMSGMMS